MFISRVRYLTKHKNLLFQSQLQFTSNNCYEINFNRTISKVNKQYFASKKPKKSQIQQKPSEKKIENAEDSQFMWKANIVFNFIGIASGFYFPKEALMFALMSNGMFQVYESSKEINKMIEISDKGENLKLEEAKNAIIAVKEKLRKIAITGGIVLIFSILTGLGVLYPSFAEYSLIGLPFWMLYNLKFNNFSHGYYLVLASLVLFQYFYFTKVFQSKEKKQSL